MVFGVLKRVVGGCWQRVGTRPSSLKPKKEKQHAESFIHVPTCWSLLELLVAYLQNPSSSRCQIPGAPNSPREVLLVHVRPQSRQYLCTWSATEYEQQLENPHPQFLYFGPLGLDSAKQASNLTEGSCIDLKGPSLKSHVF